MDVEHNYHSKNDIMIESPTDETITQEDTTTIKIQMIIVFYQMFLRKAFLVIEILKIIHHDVRKM